MNYKRKRHKAARAGCLMCKPHKIAHKRNQRKCYNKLNKQGFSSLKSEYFSKKDMNDY